jgi:hypothetical protein
MLIGKGYEHRNVAVKEKTARKGRQRGEGERKLGESKNGINLSVRATVANSLAKGRGKG